MKLPSWVFTVPYVEGGRNKEGFDCWGLVVVLYKHFYNISLNEYPDITLPSIKECSGTSEKLKVELKNQTDFYEVVSAEFGDVILLNVYGEPLHIGFCLDNEAMLHTDRKHGVAIENFTGLKWNRKIAGFYRAV